MRRSRRTIAARLVLPVTLVAMIGGSFHAGNAAPFLFRRCTAHGLIGYASSLSGNDPYTQIGMSVSGRCVTGLGTVGLRSITLAGTGEECADGPWNPYSPGWPIPCYGKTLSLSMTLLDPATGQSAVYDVAMTGDNGTHVFVLDSGTTGAGIMLEKKAPAGSVCPDTHQGPPDTCYSIQMLFIETIK